MCVPLRSLASPTLDGTGSLAGTGTSSTGAGSAVVSNSSMASCIPPTPSVSEWWTFMTMAARSPSSPSKSVNDHSGRDGSKPVIASRRANSTTVAGVWGAGTPMRHRCIDRSNSQSTHCGVDKLAGDATGRCRNRGASRVARSSLAATTPASGAESSQTTATIVERSPASCSMFHASASGSRMNWSLSTDIALSSPRPTGRLPERRP